ncbi:hypothetical protein TNIN_157201 [Trichonephila inaurata madagascariensis]|uniref:Uncharacterized protein n=1 Tax=Trichonephila inaurata madagascariensis TaxID=2747483 RepID=A0A8X6YHE2_9ARAC|nr:hypothetical protein TNIN_157201 [Trichonephila inaurata madagascariensis]
MEKGCHCLKEVGLLPVGVCGGTPAERLTCLEDGTLQNSPERKSGDSTPSQKSVNEDECLWTCLCLIGNP